MTTYLYGYGSPFQRLTLAELDKRSTWYNLDPEFRRRLLAMFDHGQDSGHDVGIGGGWRSSAQQEALFRSRYHVTPCPGDISWNGQCWTRNTGVAPSTPPGRSYHETTPPNGGLAADLIGDIAWADTVAARFGLRSLNNLTGANKELWHHQPLEVPTARRNFVARPLARFDLPGSTPAPLPPPAPTPQPPTRPPAQFDEEDDMLDKVLVPRGDWVRDNHPWLACFDSGLVRPLASNDIQPRNGNADVTDEGQYRRLAAWARIPL